MHKRSTGGGDQWQQSAKRAEVAGQVVLDATLPLVVIKLEGQPGLARAGDPVSVRRRMSGWRSRARQSASSCSQPTKVVDRIRRSSGT